MTKIVYNACYGGFSLSDAGVRRYAEVKGITLYPEKDEFGFTTYWTVPRSGRKDSTDEILWPRDIVRNDPALVQVVEEMGAKADGRCASLRVAELSEGTKYRIDEYDGLECVMTVDDYDWETA